MKKSTPDSAATDAEAIIAKARDVLNRTSPTLAELQAAREVLDKIAAEAKAEVAALDERRPALLLNATIAEISEHDDQFIAAERRGDRARAILGALAGRIAAMEAAAEEQRRRREYAALEEDVPAGMAQIERNYDAAVNLTRGCLRDLANLRLRTAAINRALPEGCAPLADPNVWRARDGAPAEERIEETVELWTQGGSILPPPAVARLENVSGRFAWLPATIGDRTGGRKVELRRFTKVTMRRARLIIPDDLAVAVALPAFRPTARPGWESLEDARGDAILHALDRLEADVSARAPAMLEEVRFVPVDDATTRQAAA